MSRLSDISIIRVPQKCADDVHFHLRSVGRRSYEGLGLWVGRSSGQIFHVEQAVIPEQEHVRTDDGVCVVTRATELHRINVWLYRNSLTLIAQIHSHPGRAYHSSTDDQYAVATTVGCVSLVVPNFANGPFVVDRIAAYRLNASGLWQPLSASQAAKLILIER